MSIFNNNNDGYSLEEISYDDMMSILSSQEQANIISQVELAVESGQHLSADNVCLKNVDVKHQELARRITENANRKLPDWLMNY